MPADVEESIAAVLNARHRPARPSIRPTVNGVDMELINGAGLGVDFSQECGTTFCTLTGMWWLDLDAAEAAHPGMFKGRPLNIALLRVQRGWCRWDPPCCDVSEAGQEVSQLQLNVRPV